MRSYRSVRNCGYIFAFADVFKVGFQTLLLLQASAFASSCEMLASLVVIPAHQFAATHGYRLRHYEARNLVRSDALAKLRSAGLAAGE